MIILGAGMAGLLAANYFRQRKPMVVEKQAELPNNHHALLRFRTDKFARVCGVSFDKVWVRKFVMFDNQFVDKPNPYVCNQYSIKATGMVMGRSVWDLEPDWRYIAPSNMIELMAIGVEAKYGLEYDHNHLNKFVGKIPIISTLPMPVLMDIVGWTRKIKFNFRPIWATNAVIATPVCNVHQTIYYADLADPRYRASIVGDRLIIEYVSDVVNKHEDWVAKTMADFSLHPEFSSIQEGTLTYHEQKYGKVVPIEEGLRKEFIYSMTKDYGIYSLGRFATWRQLLLDDLVDDLGVIRDIIQVDGGRAQLYSQLKMTAAVKGRAN